MPCPIKTAALGLSRPNRCQVQTRVRQFFYPAHIVRPRSDAIIRASRTEDQTLKRSAPTFQPSPPDAGWISVAKAATRAGYSTRQVKRWIKSGLLSASRLPSPGGKGHLRIRVGDLEALIAAGTMR